MAELVASGESDTVEFKSSARYNQHTKKRDPRLELVIVKTVAGFANGKGGTLLIGVSDLGEPIGLDNDLALVQKGDPDRYQLWLTDLLEKTMGKPAATSVAIDFPALDGHRVCRVEVDPAPSPVFVNPPGGERQADFYVRMGNSTRQMTTDEVLAYQKVHWAASLRCTQPEQRRRRSGVRVDALGQLLQVPVVRVALDEVGAGDQQRHGPLDQLHGGHRADAGVPGQPAPAGKVDFGTSHRQFDRRGVAG